MEKKGEHPYLGIIINYDRDKKLDKFSLDTLQDRYLWQNETSPQEAFARASVFVSTFKEETDFDMAQRIYNYVSNLWFMFSTPILSNGVQLEDYLSVVFLIMFLIIVKVYLATMMKTFG